MKLCVVIGAGKVGGNTEQLADAFIKGAQEAGHEAVKLHLGKLKIGPCLGCNACTKGIPCVQKDDFHLFAEAFSACDAVIWTTPLYFWGISAQLKALIDRLYSIGEKDPKGYYFLYPAKKCAMLITGADSDRHFWAFELVEHYYRRLVKYMRWTDLGFLAAGGCGGSAFPRCIEKTPHLQRAYEFGKQLR
ncbi:flavodoxin family protein [Vermiculatibacterium agrestimuris]|uniref:flavodoxin family protein n=1 Tax=Vermiculatibacterium agrestimuris TaxID=2941519 RepID=UPI00203DDEFA|nr:flavodoxin family protein [Vermiculatibacterium agrestimuris]